MKLVLEGLEESCQSIEGMRRGAEISLFQGYSAPTQPFDSTGELLIIDHDSDESTRKTIHQSPMTQSGPPLEADDLQPEFISHLMVHSQAPESPRNWD
ncbi:uncharacterized protein N7483_000153 [Penicillium malachiteum]|uniref:uncharacterized protein n=1 Tax=Penicillium malachiteum TaxID=1324776 RepID=UPI002546EE55|nr:uncharacterized protein N7483_000153 [Penicillium malachiteum]KAJ5735028.1 hypothetical protein N7483_000153 [Penicillium malachiteum]